MVNGVATSLENVHWYRLPGDKGSANNNGAIEIASL